MQLFHKAVKLTYVPNQFCNLGCKYCYLGHLTENTDKNHDVVPRFRSLLEHLESQGILIYLLMLHGAEVSTLPYAVLEGLFAEYARYCEKYRAQIKALSGQSPKIHIKTNLYNFDRLQDLFLKYKISISGSFDLPFALHEKLRVTKGGQSTLKRTIQNVLLLKDYPHGRQISCVVGKEHLAQIDAFMDDLVWLDNQGFDMVNDFYIMFAYDSRNADYKSQLDQDEMAAFLQALQNRFKNTKFENAIYYTWFKEFTHGYCTNQINCGGNNLLAQKNGDVYPCHRGQAEPQLKFGNILQDSLRELSATGYRLIAEYEKNNPRLAEECLVCDYFYLCFAGCPIQRNNTGDTRCYTCKLQKALYTAQPHRFPPNPAKSRILRDKFIRQNQPYIYDDLSVPRLMRYNTEFFEEKNALAAIIRRDPVLERMFAKGAIKLIINGESFDLYSRALYRKIGYAQLYEEDEIFIAVSKDYWNIHRGEYGINALKLMLLRNNNVVYGDELRTKMEHIASVEIYQAQMEELSDYFIFDMKNVLLQYSGSYLADYGNMWSVTTIKAREYHYQKHGNNAFYHIETLNLPFPEFRFNWYPLPHRRVKKDTAETVYYFEQNPVAAQAE